MASPEPAARQSPTHENDDNTFPSPKFSRSNSRRAASIVSSRMTDIASEEGGESAPPHSVSSVTKSGDMSTARPGTAQTGVSSSRGGGRKASASGPSSKRNSLGSSRTARPPSLAGRSHIPSLTSNAFFRPLSSQRLQAQRGGVGSRPSTATPAQPPMLEDVDDGATDMGGSVIHQDRAVGPIAQIQRHQHDDEPHPPPSRGTEATDPDTYGRITANTSPTQGHHPAGSLSDSVRPLNSKPEPPHKHLSVNVDKTLRERTGAPSPIKTPRSFRSSFLIPGKDNSEQSRSRRDGGAEKLSSEATSPELPPADSQGRQRKGTTQLPKQKQGNGRVHEYFDGNTCFFFGGRWQNSRQRPINIATGIFTVLPCALFFAFEAPWLWRNVSPAVPIVFAYLAYICGSSFIHATFSDPGILPRNLHAFPPIGEDDDPLRVGPPTNDWTLIKSAEKDTAAMEVPVKHCRTCNIWRPPRAHHCRLCDNCIETHDHHCVWLNNCIGKRNYRYFFAYVTSGSILSAYLVAMSLVQITMYKNQQNISFNAAIDHFRVPFFLVVFGILAFCYPAALMGYHIFLMARGETTREYMNSHKFVKAERYRPFSQRNAFVNLLVVLCRPRPPTYYKFKSRYQPGDQRLGDRRSGRPRKNSQGLEMDDVRPVGQGGFQGPMSLRTNGQ